jgi:hypothetical protein
MWGFGGSGDMFADGRGTQYSFNHVTAPYGFTLTDLVSYRYFIYFCPETSMLYWGGDPKP